MSLVPELHIGWWNGWWYPVIFGLINLGSSVFLLGLIIHTVTSEHTEVSICLIWMKYEKDTKRKRMSIRMYYLSRVTITFSGSPMTLACCSLP